MTDPTFEHHRKNDGTWDSVCQMCCKLVSNAKTEDGLLQAERGHTCDPTDLMVRSDHPEA